MSRRRAEGDPGVGSDSFLDVIANIVGILIILIVVAGVRVSRAPVAVVQEPAPAASSGTDGPDESASSPELLVAAEPPVPVTRTLEASGSLDRPPAVTESVEPDPEPGELEGPPANDSVAAMPAVPATIDPDPELLAKISELDRELSGLAAELQAAPHPIAAVTRQGQETQQQVAAAEAELGRELHQLASEQRRLSALQRDADDAQAALLRRQTVLAETERRQPAVRQIRHKLTPVSRPVDGPELHFHVADGRIAYVPVDDLVELLKTDLSRQKDWLARVPRHEGRVGPVGGFSMAYVVERQSMSIIDEMRVGGLVRIAVSEWRIIPEADFPSESAAEALSPGSVFIRRLQTSGLDTTLTFWVYPDSFAEFRQLQELARAEGFTVAARPLPEGTPIAASPQGTRSAGQ
jgi:hypothetical protein